MADYGLDVPEENFLESEPPRPALLYTRLYFNGYRGFSEGLKHLEFWSAYSQLFIAEVNKQYIPPLPHTLSWRLQGQIHLSTFRKGQFLAAALCNINMSVPKSQHRQQAMQAISFSLYVCDGFQLLTATSILDPSIYSLKACNYYAYFIPT